MRWENARFPARDRILNVFVFACVFTIGGCSLIQDRGVEEPGPIEPGRVILRWKADPQFSGFNVYRSQPNGTKVKVNRSPVKPQPTPESGMAPYEFEETGLIAGRDYYYLLEEIDRQGATRVWETPRKAVATPLP